MPVTTGLEYVVRGLNRELGSSERQGHRACPPLKPREAQKEQRVAVEVKALQNPHTDFHLLYHLFPGTQKCS